MVLKSSSSKAKTLMQKIAVNMTGSLHTASYLLHSQKLSVPKRHEMWVFSFYCHKSAEICFHHSKICLQSSDYFLAE